MGRRPARFAQAKLARIFAAAKQVGMAVRVDLVAGVAGGGSGRGIAVPAPPC
jgi:hypothetical protein